METTVFGKWILAGEHAVLRGSPALVFPLFAKSLKLTYMAGTQPLTAEFRGDHGPELRLLFWGVAERAFEIIGRSRLTTTGVIQIESSIPVGAGLGASAALCVGVGRWLAGCGLVSEANLYEFSRQLENLFHGESSGVDIAVALAGRGLRFERSGVRDPMIMRWKPHWYISYSGKRGVTSECVAKVKRLWVDDSTLAEDIDRDMRAAVEMATRALKMETEERGAPLLAESIRLARKSFERWGLAQGEMAQHLRELDAAGAIASKPTGSGDGGFVLSLWSTPPPSSLKSRLIPLGSDLV